MNYPALDSIPANRDWRFTLHASDLLGRFSFDVNETTTDVGTAPSLPGNEWGSDGWRLFLDNPLQLRHAPHSVDDTEVESYLFLICIDFFFSVFFFFLNSVVKRLLAVWIVQKPT